MIELQTPETVLRIPKPRPPAAVATAVVLASLAAYVSAAIISMARIDAAAPAGALEVNWTGMLGALVAYGLTKSLGIFSFAVPGLLMAASWGSWKGHFPRRVLLNTSALAVTGFLAASTVSALVLAFRRGEPTAALGTLPSMAAAATVPAVGLGGTALLWIVLILVMAIRGAVRFGLWSHGPWSEPPRPKPPTPPRPRRGWQFWRRKGSAPKDFQPSRAMEPSLRSHPYRPEAQASGITPTMMVRYEPEDEPDTILIRRAPEPYAVAPPTSGANLAYPVPEPEGHTSWTPPLSVVHEEDPDLETVRKSELEAACRRLQEALAAYGVDAEIVGHEFGPRTMTLLLKPGPQTRLAQVTKLAPDLQLRLEAGTIRITSRAKEGLIALEIPSPTPRTVYFAPLYDRLSAEIGTRRLPVILGEDTRGRPVVTDLAKLPHLLIAGTTGSGKSVMVNALLASLVFVRRPDEMRLVLIDPKRVELAPYADLPHLRAPVLLEATQATAALEWLVGEMERRYEILQTDRKRSIIEYQEQHQTSAMPYIVVVVDELADLLMSRQGQEIEGNLVRLAQKARAVGIHLVLATQRPDANIVTGLLKANMPARIAFAVPSQVNSRVILDENGAESLLGHGDMLFLDPSQQDLVRVQGCYLDLKEITRLVEWTSQWPGEFKDEPDILQAPEPRASSERPFGAAEALDELIPDAIRVGIENGTVSTSLLQRRLSVGYGRAARMVDTMADLGLIGKTSERTKGREFTIPTADLDPTFPEALGMVLRTKGITQKDLMTRLQIPPRRVASLASAFRALDIHIPVTVASANDSTLTLERALELELV